MKLCYIVQYITQIYFKLPYIFFNIYISNYRYRKNQFITLFMAINRILNVSEIQFSLRIFQTRTYNFINISMCVLVVYISILHQNYLQNSMRITFFYNRDLYKSILRSLEFPKVAGVKTIVYLKLRSPDAQPPLGTHIQTHRWGDERDVTRGIEMGSPQHCHRCRVCHIVVWGYFYGLYRSWDSRNSVAIRHLLTGVLIRPSISLGLNRNWSSGREHTKR